MENKEPLKSLRIRKYSHKEQPAHHEDKVRLFKRIVRMIIFLNMLQGFHKHILIFTAFLILRNTVPHITDPHSKGCF